MKAKIKMWWLASSVLLASMLILSSCDKDDDNDVTSHIYSISGDAAGSQVVPAVTGSASGKISGTYNPTTRVLSFTSNWTDLTGAPTSGGFYNGATGTTGTAIAGRSFNLGATPGVTGSVSDTLNLTTDEAQQLLNGGWYYSYSTSANPGGEIRGQINSTQ